MPQRRRRMALLALMLCCLPSCAGSPVAGPVDIRPVGNDGTVYMSTMTEVLAVDDAGVLSLVRRFDDLQAELGIRSTLDPPYLWSMLAIDADGALLVSDFSQQLVARVSDPAVLVRSAVLVTNGLNASFTPSRDLLIRVMDPDAYLAGEQEPDELAVYGR